MRITKEMLKEGEDFTKAMVKEDSERFIVMNKAKAFHNYIQGGSMIHFKYDAKHKDTLPFWDKYPTIIVLKYQGSRMLGLNLHFVPFPLRKVITEYVLKQNINNIKKNKPISIDYNTMKQFLVASRATICIRSYLVGRITSRITFVKSHRDYILGATSLKTDKIYGLTSDQIYKIALGRNFSTKKKIGSRRTDRAKKKKLLKIK
jgi:hypothetical protein